MAKDLAGRNGNGPRPGQHPGANGGGNSAPNTPIKTGQPVGLPAGPPSNSANDSPKNKPVHEVRMGRICGAIWPQQGNEGQTWHNVTLSRLYRDNAGNWQRSDSFGRTDLPLVAKVADMCHTWIYQQGHSQDDTGQQQ